MSCAAGHGNASMPRCDLSTPSGAILSAMRSPRRRSSAARSDTFPVFDRLDLRVDTRDVRNRAIVTSYLDILNIYNRQHTEAFIYTNSYWRRSGGLGLPILPPPNYARETVLMT